MRSKYLNVLVIPVGLLAACVIAGQWATAQSKRKAASFEEAPVATEPVDQPAVADPERPQPAGRFGRRRGMTNSARPYLRDDQALETDPPPPPRYREVMEKEVVEVIVDEQGERHIIRKKVPVLVDVNNEFARKKIQLNQSLRACVDAYQTAQRDEVKREMEEKMEIHLSELFDMQQQEREAQLKPMEERVKKLRETLNKRAAMRNDLVQLRLKVLLQDADGMGWGPDEFLTPLRDPNEPQGTYPPFRTPLSPNQELIPYRGIPPTVVDEPAPIDPAGSNDTSREPIKKPAGGVPEPVGSETDSTS